MIFQCGTDLSTLFSTFSYFVFIGDLIPGFFKKEKNPFLLPVRQNFSVRVTTLLNISPHRSHIFGLYIFQCFLRKISHLFLGSRTILQDAVGIANVDLFREAFTI